MIGFSDIAYNDLQLSLSWLSESKLLIPMLQWNIMPEFKSGAPHIMWLRSCIGGCPLATADSLTSQGKPFECR